MSFPSRGGSVNHDFLDPCVDMRAAISGSGSIGSCKWLAACAFRNIKPIDAGVANHEVFSSRRNGSHGNTELDSKNVEIRRRIGRHE